MQETYLKLHHSEGIVAQMVAQIFSGFVTSGQVNDMNEEAMIKRSIEIATKMAVQVDQTVDSDNENKE